MRGGRTICQVSSQPVIERASARDSCPGTLQVHPAADGGLARVRIPAGVLCASQWQALIEASVELADGNLDLTSRGNVQLRGLRPGAETALAARLVGAGLLPSLAHERVRNVLASPLTGLDGRGSADLRPLVGELDRALCARPELAALSGRFLFALDDGRGDVAAMGADVTLSAVDPRRATLSLAGMPVGIVPISKAVITMLASARAFLRLRSADGSNAWRIAELADGPTRIAAALAPCQALSPRAAADPAAAVSPTTLEQSVPCPVGPLGQRDGSTALVIGIPLGRLSAVQATALSGHDLILTPWRSIVVPNLSGAYATTLSTAADAAGLIVDSSSPWLGVTACTGRPGCAKALTDVRADARLVHGTGAAGSTGARTGPAVHWAGCERRCGTPAGDVLIIVATAAGYRLEGGDSGTNAATLSSIGDRLEELRAMR